MKSQASHMTTKGFTSRSGENTSHKLVSEKTTQQKHKKRGTSSWKTKEIQMARKRRGNMLIRNQNMDLKHNKIS